MQRVICIGSASQDIFFPTDEGVILETPEDVTAQVKVAFELGGKFRARNRYESIGGVAANVSVGLARLGIPVQCYSHIGGDELGLWIQRTLEQNGVKTDILIRDPKVRSDLSAIIVIEQRGDRIIFHNRDANEQLVVDPAKLETADWFYVSALNGAWRENIKIIQQVAKEETKRIALNPGQHNLKEDSRLMLDLLRHTHALFLNKDEAIELLLTNQIETDRDRLNNEVVLAKALHQEGPEVIVITDGKRGAWATTGHDVWHAKSYEPHGLISTTGAGDAFGSGFFAAYLKGLPLDTCLRYGICNAGNVVGFYGATEGLLDEETITELLDKVQIVRLT